jgi:hypothetical protein
MDECICHARGAYDGPCQACIDGLAPSRIFADQVAHMSA